MSQAKSGSVEFKETLATELCRLNKEYGRHSTDPATLAEKYGVTVRKMEGYLTGEFTPSLGTFARMFKGLSDHRLAKLVRAAEEPAGTDG